MGNTTENTAIKFCEDVVVKNFETIAGDKLRNKGLMVGCLYSELQDQSTQEPFIWDSLCSKEEENNEDEEEGQDE